MIADNWHGCYRQGWGKNLVPEAFAHPAKVSFSLAERIYAHLREEGWIREGSVILDPFAGIGGFALHAMLAGCEFVGVELEPKFVALAEQNIAAWSARYAGRMPGWGSAVILQGDSRKLLTWAFAGPKVDGVVGSPPHADSILCGEYRDPDRCAAREARYLTAHPELKEKRPEYSDYGNNPSNLGNLPDKGFEAVVGSPPYCDQSNRGGDQATDPGMKWAHGERTDRGKVNRSNDRGRDYGTSPGQLAAMPEGSVDAAVSSPPYNLPMSQDHSGSRGGKRGHTPSEPGAFARYGNTPGQLEGMPEGAFEGVVSSPPYAERHAYKDEFRNEQRAKKLKASGARIGGTRGLHKPSGEHPDNLAQLEEGDTFWLAARQILDQCFLAVRPGGHAVWIVKAFVRKGKRVDFPGQWRQLCEAVGFRCVHVHRAWLVEDTGTQGRTDGGETRLVKERKSFFRRLAEKKGSPRIDWEEVQCFERP